MNKKIYCGIDGGISGALCFIDELGKILEHFPMPIMPAGNGRNEYDCQQIILKLMRYQNLIVILEKAQYTPVLGGISAFSFGKSYGTMIGILSALNIRYHLVAARTWQSEMFRDINTKDTKKSSEVIAKRLYPDKTFIVENRGKKIHSGLTDSCLIAEYGRRHNL